MNTKKALRMTTAGTCILLVFSCQKEAEYIKPDLPYGYMYTLTIPEIMELNIADLSKQ